MPFSFADSAALGLLVQRLAEHRRCAVVGLPGCGKTTWIRERLLRTASLDHPVVSGERWTGEREAYVWIEAEDPTSFLDRRRCAGVIHEAAQPLREERLWWVPCPPPVLPATWVGAGEPIEALHEWRQSGGKAAPPCLSGSLVSDYLSRAPLYQRKLEAYLGRLDLELRRVLDGLALFAGPWRRDHACELLHRRLGWSQARADSELCRARDGGLVFRCHHGGVELERLPALLHACVLEPLRADEGFRGGRDLVLEIVDGRSDTEGWGGRFTPRPSSPVALGDALERPSAGMLALAATWSRFFPFPRDLEIDERSLPLQLPEAGPWLYALLEYGNSEQASELAAKLPDDHAWKPVLQLTQMKAEAYRASSDGERGETSAIHDYVAARVEVAAGDLEAAARGFERALSKSDADPCLRAFVLSGLGFTMLNVEEIDRARDFLEEARAIAVRYGFVSVLARTAGYLGNLERRWGAFADADGHYQQGVQWALAAGDQRMAAVFTSDRLVLSFDRQQSSTAERYVAAVQAMERCGPSARHNPMAWILDGFGQLLGQRYLDDDDGFTAEASAYRSCQQLLTAAATAVADGEVSETLLGRLESAVADRWQHLHHAGRAAQLHLAQAGLLTALVLRPEGGDWLVEGRPLQLRSETLDALLERLVVHGARDRGRFVTAETLCREVWGAGKLESLRNRLKVSLNKLRSLLPADLIESKRGAGYRLRPEWRLIPRPGAASTDPDTSR